MVNKIKSYKARLILDSRGFPSVRVDLTLDNGITVGSNAPSGASTGAYEALERRDGGSSWCGKGVSDVLNDLNKNVIPEILNIDPRKQDKVDKILLQLDGTAQKSKLGANCLLPLSMAVCRAGAVAENQELFQWISCLSESKPSLPIPTMNVLNGGVHANNNLDVQEFMIVPWLAGDFLNSLRAGVEIYHELKSTINNKQMSTSLGDEGGFAPDLKNNLAALDLLNESISNSRYSLGKDVFLALDVASSELFKNNYYQWEGSSVTFKDLVDVYVDWAYRYPIVSIEDGMDESHDEAWSSLNEKLGKKINIIGDDLLVTQVAKINHAIENNLCNTLLVKLNQVGTVTETIDAIKKVRLAGWDWSVSHRSGETEDDFIADLAVGTGSRFIKTGAPARGERTSKYNRLIAIASDYKDLKFKNIGVRFR
ncbi:phosphopyruvate hydratase [bacterium]|nr:phosphopyruvate hydratase [bacterium]